MFTEASVVTECAFCRAKLQSLYPRKTRRPRTSSRAPTGAGSPEKEKQNQDVKRRGVAYLVMLLAMQGEEGGTRFSYCSSAPLFSAAAHQRFVAIFFLLLLFSSASTATARSSRALSFVPTFWTLPPKSAALPS